MLRDAAGAVTARLAALPGPAVPGGPAGHFGPAAPLPAGLTPARRGALTGRWVPPDREFAARAPRPPHAVLRDDGVWTGSDGCNHNIGGRWASGPDGVLIATESPTTLAACDGMVPVPQWLARSARAGLDGPTLVLFDVDGRELGRLTRP